MKKTGVVETEWQSYMNEVIPPGAPEVQRTESKRAFYAGARSLLRAVVDGFDEGSEATDEDVAGMEEIHAELEKFYQDVKAGKA